MVTRRRRMIDLIRQSRLIVPALVLLTGIACGGSDELQRVIAIDGSSTVFPIAEAVAEEFQLAVPGTRVTVGISGTGGGFSGVGDRQGD